MEDKELDLYVLLTQWNNYFKKFDVIQVVYNEANDCYVAHTDDHIEWNFPLDVLVSHDCIHKWSNQGLVDKLLENGLTKESANSIWEEIFYQVCDITKRQEEKELHDFMEDAADEVLKSIDEEENNPLNIQTGGTHYKDRGIQPIEYIMANNLDFCQGNVVKYVTRYKQKAGKQDLEKAKHYIDFLIYQHEKENQND